jgi:protein involved in sex pheromone biosynthesis
LRVIITAAAGSSSNVALISAIVIAVFASVTAPLLLTLLTSRQRRAEKEQDYKREDDREEEREEKAMARAAVVAAAAEAVREKAEEAARLLQENNVVTKSRLDSLDAGVERVHTLVNSDKTAALQRDLDSAKEKLILLTEIVELKRAAGLNPHAETSGAIAETKRRISELGIELDDRHRQATLAEKQMQEHANEQA